MEHIPNHQGLGPLRQYRGTPRHPLSQQLPIAGTGKCSSKMTNKQAFLSSLKLYRGGGCGEGVLSCKSSVQH
eukprot:6461540-Amphidinium_carterae.1